MNSAVLIIPSAPGAGSFTNALDVSGGASMAGTNIIVINGETVSASIFDDGFESGDTSAWSFTAP